MKKIYTTTLLLIFATLLFSQKETSNWIFGSNNWVDFNTNPITAGSLPVENISTSLGTISVSDKEGNLLFYSSGTDIFDRNHQIMPNGELNKFTGFTHPIFTFPKPNSEHLHYLIYQSLDIVSTTPFPILKWSEIDMSLNNGLGDVKVDENNEIIASTLLEKPTGKITAILHDNLVDIWVVSHKMDSDAYYVWLASDSGINPDPVISNIGSDILEGIVDSGNGEIKTSSDGSKIAAVNRGISKVELFDFNRTNGTLSNLVTLFQFFKPNGVEFSPSGQYLYVTHEGFQFDSRIVQFDLWAFNQTLSIGTPTFAGISGGLQLASDGKIYCGNPGTTSLGIINEPDNDGFNVNFEQEGLNGISTFFYMDLPSFFHKYFDKPYFSYDGICTGNTTTFLIDGFDDTIDSVLWDFGDPNSGVDNTSTDISPSHNYPSPGSYYVTLSITSNNQTFTKKQLVHIAPTSINIGNDSTLCSNQVLTADAYVPNADYLWSNGFTTSAIGIMSPGTYTVSVSVANCPTLTDEIIVNHLPAPNPNLGGDGAICNGVPVILDATNTSANYIWSTGSSTSSITVFTNGIYAVTVTSPNGCSEVEEVTYTNSSLALNPSQANLKCFNDSSGVALVFLSGGQAPISYQWNDGDTLYTNNHLAAGNYSVTATDIFGCSAMQDFTLTEPTEFIVDIVTNSDNPNTGALDGSVLIQPSGGTPPYIFDWEAFGVVTDPLMEDLENGIYNITITDDNGCEEIIQANVGNVVSTEEISFLEKIKLFPNPTNDFLFIKIPNLKNENLEISVSNILGQPIRETPFLEKGKTEFSIDVKNWSSGIYFLKIKMEKEEKIWKFNVVK